MRRIVRDSWAWRGGFAPDELQYEPVLADATAGPIGRPAAEHWPVLSSQLEAAWSIPAAEELGIRTLTAPAAAHLALVARTGGYHATLPRHLPELVPVFEGIRAADPSVPTWEEALELLERGGVIERSATRLALLRPTPPTVARMRLMRDMLDDHEHREPDDPVANRLLRAVWRQTYSGIGVSRFRELAAHGRLRVTVAERAALEEPRDPFFEVGQASLPDFRNAPGAVLDHSFPERSWIALGQFVGAPASAARTWLWATPPEVFAALLGAGRGANAVRRAVRGMVVWLLLADHTGARTGPVEMAMAALSRAVAEVLGLKRDADHRKLCRLLVGDLERRGLVSLSPGESGRIVLLPVPAPDATTVREALGQWMAWRVSSAEEPLEGLLRLAARHRERHVRGPWAAALEERRIGVEVLPGAPG